MLVKAGEHVQASEVELSADELKEPLATDSAMSWSKQHTTVRRCGDHNEHPLQHHNAHSAAQEGETHKSFPHNKTTEKQKQKAHIRRSSTHRRRNPAWARQLHHVPVAAGWVRPGAGLVFGEKGGVASTQFSNQHI